MHSDSGLPNDEHGPEAKRSVLEEARTSLAPHNHRLLDITADNPTPGGRCRYALGRKRRPARTVSPRIKVTLPRTVLESSGSYRQGSGFAGSCGLVACCQESSNSSSYKVRVPTDPFIAPAHRAMLYSPCYDGDAPLDHGNLRLLVCRSQESQFIRHRAPTSYNSSTLTFRSIPRKLHWVLSPHDAVREHHSTSPAP